MPSKRSARNQLYEGKAKILFEGPDKNTIIQYFKDDATAFNNQKKDTISGKGILNNRISEFIMTRLGEINIPTHFIRTLNMREQLVKRVEIIPLEVIVRNTAAGSLCKRLGVEEGLVFDAPLVEFCYKEDAYGDPVVSEEHIITLGWATPIEVEEMKHLALRINDFLYGMFAAVGIRLIDYKLEFGRYQEQEDDYIQVILADEISPDSCRLWDIKTTVKLDKARFRLALGGVAEAYQEVAKRLGVLINQNEKENEG
jgi:phosphoribosylaminoimidazole-succinocarboxamide synthase